MNSPQPLYECMLKAFEKVPDLYLILSPELVILTASEAYLKATYTTREEITGKYLFDVFPDNLMAKAANAVKNLSRSLQQVLATGQPHRMAVQHYDVPNANQPGGFAEKYWLPLNTPVPDEQGQVQYIIHKVEDVTERILTENKQTKEYHHLKDAQEIGHIGSFERLLTEKVISCSDEWYRIHGLEPQSEVITKDRLFSFFHPEDKKEVTEAIEHTLRTGKPLHLIHRIIRANGDVRYVQRKVEVLKDKEGNPYRVYGTVQDITEQVEARKKAQEQSYLLKATEVLANLGSYEIDVATMTIRFSDGMYKLFGEEPKAFVPSLAFVDACTHPVDVPVVKAILDQAIQEKLPYHYTRRIRRTDGAWRTLEAQGLVECDATGNAIKLIGLVQDVTERIMAEQELKQSQELLKTTVDSSLDMIQVFEAIRDESGEIIDFKWILNNHASEQIYGDVVGKRLLEHNPGVVEVGIFDTFKQVVETGLPDQSERHYVHEQFNGWFYQSTVKLGDGVATTTRDITAHKQAEQDLRITKEFLQDTLDTSLQVVQVFEAVRNEEGKIIDFIWLYTNRKWKENYGNEMVGKRLLQENPGVIESGLFEKFVEVTEKGVPVGHEQHYAFEQFDGWFYQTLSKLGDGFVMTTVDVTESKQAKEEILHLKDEIAQRATDKYQALFNAVDEGFAIQELLTDDDGNVVDVVYQEVNQAFEQHTGMKDVGGKKVSDFLPHLEQHWLNALTQVYKTGQPLRGESYTTDLGRWISYQYSRIGGEGSRLIAVVFNDITERKQREQQKSFLIKLGDALRPLSDAMEVQRVAMRVLGEHLHVDRVIYAEINIDEDWFEATDNYTSKSVQKVTGRFPFTAFGPPGEKLKKGESLIIHDVTAEVDGDSEKSFYSMDVHAVVAVPLIKQGKLVADLSVHQTTPRHWLHHEITLIHETAERTWAAVERVKVEEALRKSEEKYRTLFNSMDEGYCIIQMLYDEAGNPTDFRYLQVNQAFERNSGLHDAEGKTIRELAPDIEPKWIDIYDQIAQKGNPLRFEESSVALHHTFSLYAFRIGDPADHKVAVVFSDITERKKAEKELQESEEIRRLAIESGRMGTWRWDMQNRLVWGDTQFLSLWGLQPSDEPYPLSVFTGRMTPEGAAEMKEIVAKATDAGEEFDGLLKISGGPTDGHWIRWRGRAESARPWILNGVSFDVTFQQHAEEALRESEERFRNLVETYAQAVWETTATGEVVVDSPSWRAYTGQTVEEWLGYGWLDAIHPDDRAYAERQWRRAVASRSLVDAEFRLKNRLHGGYKWTNVRATPILDENGNITKWVGMNIDIHKQKEAEEVLANYNAMLEQQVAARTYDLEESKERFQAAINVSPVVLGILKSIRNKEHKITDFRVEWVSRSGETMVGRDITGLQLTEQFPDLRKVRKLQRLIKTAETGQPTDHEFHYNSGGFDLWVRWKAVKLEEGLFVSIEDITERKKAELEMRESKLFAEQVVEATPDFVMILNLQTDKIEFVNRNAYLGDEKRYKETMSSDLETILRRAHHADRKKLRQFIDSFRTAQDDEAQTLEYRVIVGEKQIWYRTRSKVFKRDENGTPTHYIGIVQEITKVKQLEEENLEMRLNQQKETLLAILDAQEEERRRISESLHNGVGQLLYAARLNLERVKDNGYDLKANEALKNTQELLSEAIKETRRASHELVPALLEEFGLEKALADLCEMYDQSALYLSCKVEGLTKKIDAHVEVALYRIIQELINNIVKHAEATAATVHLKAQRNQILLQVRDNGKGFSRQETSRNGIGLKTIEDRVKLLGGNFSITAPKAGKGTLVTITLPVNLSLKF